MKSYLVSYTTSRHVYAHEKVHVEQDSIEQLGVRHIRRRRDSSETVEGVAL